MHDLYIFIYFIPALDIQENPSLEVPILINTSPFYEHGFLLLC